MTFKQYVEWEHTGVEKYEYPNHSKEEVIAILKEDIISSSVLKTWANDENGKRIAYFEKNTQLIEEEEELKKATKEAVLKEVLKDTRGRGLVRTIEAKVVLDILETHGYIKFKEEPKKYRVFVKLVTIGGEDKNLYYVDEYHLTENIDEAQRFGLDDYKCGYSYEYVYE